MNLALTSHCILLTLTRVSRKLDAYGLPQWDDVTLPAGNVRPAVLAPARVLGTPCRAADPCDPEVVQLAADLIATMQSAAGCVGLAANQIGVDLKVFSLDVSSHPKTRTNHGLFVLVNPEIVAASRNEKAREGCLSVPDFTGDVKRATRLTVAGWLPGTGTRVEFSTDAFEARAIQHEVDHLNGLLFLDRTAGPHAIHVRKTYL